jgi:hypothetical protein
MRDRTIMMKRKKKRALLISAVIVLAFLFVTAASFIPTLRLKTPGMREIRGEWVRVYYERREEAALDVFSLSEQRAQQLVQKLGFKEKPDVSVYIYDSQFTFQAKKYGLLIPLVGLDWYIGDNRGTNVLLTSPANPGKVHGYEDCKMAVLHEMVHAYNYLMNRHMPLWLNEGVALYLSNGNPPDNLYKISQVPTLQDTRTKNPVKFSNMGGYDFAYTYIEYLDKPMDGIRF